MQKQQQQQRGANYSVRAHRTELPPSPVPPEELEALWFSRGDVVPCKVEWSNSRGARVSTLQDSRIIGYVPAKEGPFWLRKEGEVEERSPYDRNTGDWTEPLLQPGHVREFQVLKIPDDMEYHGRGPLMSACLVDLDTLWGRAEQMLRQSQRAKETVRVQFAELNDGGLIAWFLGLRLFLPLSHIVKEDPNAFLSKEELIELYVNNGPTEVAVTEVDAHHRRFVCSQTLAVEYSILRSLKVGSLVWGTIRRMEDFGAFVGIDGTKVSGLLHISNISRTRVAYMEDVFKIGDRVRAVVLSVEDNYTRLSLSTAELEEHAGDMLKNQVKVYAGAEEQVKVFLELQEDSVVEEASVEVDAPVGPEILASGHF